MQGSSQSLVFTSPRIAQKLAKTLGTPLKSVPKGHTIGKKSVNTLIRDIKAAKNSAKSAKVTFR